MPRISLINLTKRFGDVIAVDGVELEIQPGELLVLAGPSGCGKTTILRMIAGLEQPDSGTIRIDGHDVRPLPPHRRRIAMVFQHHALYPHLTARENMAFGLNMRRLPRKEVARRVDAVAETLKIRDLLDRKPAQLSGGQRQRVALGRAVVQQPTALLLDEPFSSLDPALRTEMRGELARLQRQFDTTMIHVTHDQQEAMQLGDRIAIMDKGQLQQLGTARDVYQRPANPFVAGFLGDPPMNLFRGVCTIVEGCPHLRQTGFTIKLPPNHPQAAQASDGPITWGIRPEDINISVQQPARVPAEAMGRGEVLSSQTWGPDTIVWIGLGDARMAARLQGQRDLQPGQKVNVLICNDRCHLFSQRSKI